MSTLAPNYITLSHAASMCPHRPSVNTIRRWIRKGQKARNGETVKLQAHRIGPSLFTTAEWLNAYWASLAQADRKHFDQVTTEVSDGQDATDDVLKEFGL